MTEEYKNSIKDNTYYDNSGKQILLGDLLKIYHFGSGNRTQYVYHVVVMEKTKDFPVMALRAYYAAEPHCRLYVCVNKERVHKTAKIIGMQDWETKRKRIKIQINERLICLK